MVKVKIKNLHGNSNYFSLTLRAYVILSFVQKIDQKVSEHVQAHTADQPTAPRERATEHL